MGCNKKKGRLRCHKRPKSREETPKEGSDSGVGLRLAKARRRKRSATLDLLIGVGSRRRSASQAIDLPTIEGSVLYPYLHLRNPGQLRQDERYRQNPSFKERDSPRVSSTPPVFLKKERLRRVTGYFVDYIADYFFAAPESTALKWRRPPKRAMAARVDLCNLPA